MNGIERNFPTAEIDDSALLRPAEVCEWLSMSRSAVFEMIGSGKLRSAKVGRARRVTAGALRSFVAELEEPECELPRTSIRREA